MPAGVYIDVQMKNQNDKSGKKSPRKQLITMPAAPKRTNRAPKKPAAEKAE